MSPLDLPWIRAQFPALSLSFGSLQNKDPGGWTTEEEKPVAFLDGPGGTQVPEIVLEAIRTYLVRQNANAHGAFITSTRTDALVKEARLAAADFLVDGLLGIQVVPQLIHIRQVDTVPNLQFPGRGFFKPHYRTAKR